jgi:hypothetical protein
MCDKGQVRRPKVERNPKTEIRTWRARTNVFRGTTTKGTNYTKGSAFRIFRQVRISDFGLPSALGLRVSDFPRLRTLRIRQILVDHIPPSA